MVKINAYWSTLMQYSTDLSNARMSGDTIRVKRAETKYLAYMELCRDPDVELLMDIHGTE